MRDRRRAANAAEIERLRRELGAVAGELDRSRGEIESLRLAVRQAKGAAETADRSREQFLSMLSHELRSPLNAMAGWTKLLEQAGGFDPLVQRAADAIERSIRMQARIIDDLLDASRLLSAQLTLERRRVDLTAVLRSCVEEARPSAGGKQITLVLDTGEDGESLGVPGDRARLRQIITQLLDNAVKFTGEGGTIRASLRLSDGWAEISVEDTGQGIDPILVPHVFDLFRQADSSSTRRHGGLGLGLSIVRQLTALHGGTVAAESAGVGRGACFRLRLPAAPEGSPHVSPAGPAPAAGTMPPLDILLVEDDAAAREALSLALRSRGARVREAASVRDALREYDLRPPTVLVSDIAMPHEDGYALVRSIREREEGRAPRAVAIAITGFASRKDYETALGAGFDDHLAKPVDVDSLCDRIRILSRTRAP